jgi:O-antigen/teichoic acid export membrane protein
MAAANPFNSFLKPIQSAGIVGIGKALQGIMSLVYVALAARTLGVVDFGSLMLIHSLVFGASQILRFQTWQAVIRYGSEAVQNNQGARFKKLIRYLYRLDLIAAVIGLAFILLVMAPAARLFELPPEMVGVTQIYGLSIAFLIMTSTPMGILRLFDRFDLIAHQTVVAPFVRFIGALFLFFTSGDLTGFLIVWFIASIISRIALQFFAMRELRRAPIWKQTDEPYTGHEPGILRFILSHNLSRGLNVSQPQIALLVVGWLMGPAAAGVYKIAQQFADIIIKPVDKLLIPAIYPELAKLQGESGRKERRQVLAGNAIFAGLMAVTVLVFLIGFGDEIIATIIGPAFRESYGPMVVLTLAGAVTLIAFPLGPLLSSAGRIKHMIAIDITVVVLYIASIIVLAPALGLIGPAYAAVIASSASALLLFLAGRDLFRKSGD